MICSRCLDLIDVADANFCPRCGRDLRLIRSQTLTGAELRAFESRVIETLAQLKRLRSQIERCHSEAAQVCHVAALNLLERRLALVVRMELRLEAGLKEARIQRPGG